MEWKIKYEESQSTLRHVRSQLESAQFGYSP